MSYIYLYKKSLKVLRITLFFSFLGCGEFKLKEVLDPEIENMIAENQVKKDGCEGSCTNVVISDRFAITAAHCLEHYENK